MPDRHKCRHHDRQIAARGLCAACYRAWARSPAGQAERERKAQERSARPPCACGAPAQWAGKCRRCWRREQKRVLRNRVAPT